MRAESPKISNWGLQSKVLLLFTAALIVVLAAVYVVRQNERVLGQTLVELSNPATELESLHEISSLLPLIDNRFRYFSLTNDSLYLHEYNHLYDSLKIRLTLLSQSFKNDSLTISELDSVSYLLLKQKAIIDEYWSVKKRRESFNFTERVLTTVIENAPDSLIKKQTTNTTIITSYDTLPVSPSSAAESSSPKQTGLRQRIKQAFSKSNSKSVRSTTKDPVIRSVTRIESDTSAITRADSLNSQTIYRELTRLKSNDINTYQELINRELVILQYNSRLIEQISNIFSRVENNLQINNGLRSDEAIKTATQSLYIIGIISLLAILLILPLVILTISGVRRSMLYRKELVLANIEATQLAKVKEEFLANMSHEIRTPLNAIIGFSDLLKGTELNNEQDKYLDAVRRSSKHLLEMVDDILDLSKLVAGKFRIENKSFLMKDVLDDLIKPFTLLAEKKGLKFITGCSTAEAYRLEGDPLRLRQILYNLLSNAIKFTSEGHISLTCKSAILGSGKVEFIFAIEDSGIGISPDNTELIFEDFQQIDTSSSRHYSGSGLGLAISRRLARLQGGDLMVESETGRGSVFTLLISYNCISTIKEKEEKNATIEFIDLPGKKVLIADDDAFNILLLKVIAEKHHLHVMQAFDGYQARDLLNENRFHLALIDLQMPGLSGIQLIEIIRSHPDPFIAEMPVIAFTANKLAKFDYNLINLGFNEVIEKPFEESDLIAKISNYLNKDGDDLPQYDLSNIRQFSGGNINQEIEILNTFINNAVNAESEFLNALAMNDFKKISDIAHRILTSYNYIKAVMISKILEEIENSAKTVPEKETIRNLIQSFINENKKLISEIRNKMQNLP